MIDFLNWWTESWYRVVVALLILGGLWQLLNDGMTYLYNAYVVKVKSSQR
jgi:hypothetical protein